MIPITALTDESDCVDIVTRACCRYGFIPARSLADVRTPYYLQFYENDIVLRPLDRQHGDINIDFTAGRTAHRLQYGGGKKQPLAKAVGLNRWSSLSVVDATAGFATDATVLASLGAQVTLIERCPALACMLEQAIAKAGHHDMTKALAERMQVEFTDSIHWLQNHRCDVVYLDPMYPHTNKSAQVKKNMQALRALVGPDTDSSELLAAALHCATRRVVVKRPKGAPPVSTTTYSGEPTAPDTAINSPNTRYDIYTTTVINPNG